MSLTLEISGDLLRDPFRGDVGYEVGLGVLITGLSEV